MELCVKETSFVSFGFLVVSVFLIFWWLGRQVDRKLQIANLELFALSPGNPPYKVAVYVPGSKVSNIKFIQVLCIVFCCCYDGC